MSGKRKVRRLIAAATAGSCAIGLLAACGSQETGSAAPTTPTAAGKTCKDVDLSKPPASPVTIRIGRGKAAEEPLWLLKQKPDLAKHANRWYKLELVPFDSTETRLVALQAGDIDGATISPQVFVTGTARGSLHLVALATIMKEADKGAFGTTFITKSSSGINSIKDLKGKKIGIVGLGTDPDYLAKAAVNEAGFDFAKDAKYIVLPFPAQAEALAKGQIDVATSVEPFYTLAHAKGGVKDVFTARDVTGYSFDLLTLALNRSFIDKNLGAACALRDDFAASMDWYRGHVPEARKLLAGSEFVQAPLPVYLKTKDYGRPAGGAFDPAGIAKLIDTNIKLGIMKPSDRIDPKRLYVPGVTAGQ